MKLLRVKASNYKNCCDDFTIDFIAKSRKTSEDKEYELQEIAEGLYVCNAMTFIGKNASGKTTALDLLRGCYTILGEFQLYDPYNDFDNVKLEMVFYEEGYIYRYSAVLKSDETIGYNTVFSDQKLFRKQYFKSHVKDIYEDAGFSEVENLGELPEDVSDIFFVSKKKTTQAVYFDCNGEGTDTYRILFRAMKKYGISQEILARVIRIFDDHIQNLEMIDEKHYRLTIRNEVKELSDAELMHFLSSGTTKGVLLYIYMVASLQNGFDLLIDEVENHFHKTLVENMISLYKDKSVNRRCATLVFTTHYCEVLDLFNRQDNIWIARSDNHVYLENMYDQYNIRPELLKSRQYYNDTFHTSVSYEDLMLLKKELMR